MYLQKYCNFNFFLQPIIINIIRGPGVAMQGNGLPSFSPYNKSSYYSAIPTPLGISLSYHTVLHSYLSKLPCTYFAKLSFPLNIMFYFDCSSAIPKFLWQYWRILWSSCGQLRWADFRNRMAETTNSPYFLDNFRLLLAVRAPFALFPAFLSFQYDSFNKCKIVYLINGIVCANDADDRNGAQREVNHLPGPE